MALGKKRSAAKAEKAAEPTPAVPEKPTAAEKPATAKKSVASKPKTEPPLEASAEPPAASPPVPGQSMEALLDESKLVAFYANFARVMGTPEEVILDFGLNPEPFGVPSEPIRINDRIVVNLFTAKRLLTAMQTTVARHEAAFGVVETDVQKRLAPPTK